MSSNVESFSYLSVSVCVVLCILFVLFISAVHSRHHFCWRLSSAVRTTGVAWGACSDFILYVPKVFPT